VAAWGKSIVILGGGFGGLTAANDLRLQLGKEHRVTVIDKKSQFFMGLAMLWVLSGQRRPWEKAGDLTRLNAKGIRFIESEVTRIDTYSKRVSTTDGEIPFDYLIMALGADQSPESVPGFAAGALDLYTVEGAAELYERLKKFDHGKLMVMISAVPLKCPSAPYEAAMLMDEMLRKKGVRDKIDIQVFTPEPQPLPIAGPTVGAQVMSLLSEKGIGFNPRSKPKEIDAKSRTVTFENGTKANYDLLAGVPTHVVPNVTRNSTLAGPSGWIPVDRGTLQTRIPDIFAIGDVAQVMTANNLPMPKLGTLAEEEAKVVARNIVHALFGEESRTRYEGNGTCFVEVGGGKACLARGEFLAHPAPRVVLDRPTVEALELKRSFEASRMAEWF
jgi:sulfide:quinone oxidoreductase